MHPVQLLYELPYELYSKSVPTTQATMTPITMTMMIGIIIAKKQPKAQPQHTRPLLLLEESLLLPPVDVFVVTANGGF